MDEEKKPALQQEPVPESGEPETSAPGRRGREAYMLLHDLVYILVVVTLFFVFAVRLVGVSGPSMTPTLLNGDYVLVQSNFTYHSIESGDVVVMLVRDYDDQPIVKRVIATEGQEVRIDFDEGKVYVDDQLLDEPYINNYEVSAYQTFNNYADGLQYPVIVPEGCLFVLGDNRANSADSRYAPIGLVDERCVLGKVLAVVFPFDQIGLVD